MTNLTTPAAPRNTEEQLVLQFPVKCDHCPWTGTVADAVMVDGKAQCPKCGGSLAGNRLVDNVMGALHECVNLDEIDY